jgi:predicted RNA-binding protein with PIN domain
MCANKITQALTIQCVPVQGEMTLPPVLLVDGYNVLNSWLQTPGGGERKEAARRSWEEARQILLLDCAEYSQHRGIKLIVVFDALGNRASNSTVRCAQKTISYFCLIAFAVNTQIVGTYRLF